MTNEFLEFESPGLDTPTEVAEDARGRGVIEMLG